MENVTYIELPLWLQIVGSVACGQVLWYFGKFSDNAVPGCKWVGHSGPAEKDGP